MREIKYRIFYGGEMCPITSMDWRRDDLLVRIKGMTNMHVTNPKSLSVYTGLNDKNGVEIYEGDYLRWEDWKQELTETPDIYVITWKDDAAKFVLNCYRNGLRLTPQDADFRDSTEFEVIGNIYENPELLR